MPRQEDTFTSTVDGAAAHAALFAVDDYDDGPSLDEVQDHAPRRLARPACSARRPIADRPGWSTVCGLLEHGGDVRHEPYPWVVSDTPEPEPF